MSKLEDLKRQHPEYAALSDQELADRLYKAYYQDMPRAEFNRRVGLKTVGEGTAFGIGAADGVTFNTTDELAGNVAATVEYTRAGQERLRDAVRRGDYLQAVGESARGFVAPIEATVRGVINRDAGAAGSARARVTNEVRDVQKRAREERPGYYLAGNVAGGVATSVIPGTTVLRGVSRARQVARAAGMGGAIGAAYGFGDAEGDYVDRSSNAAVSGVLGAALGGGVQLAAAPVANMVGGAGNRALNYLRGLPREPGTVTTQADLRGAINLPDVAQMRARGQAAATSAARNAIGLQSTQAADAFGVRLTRGQATGDQSQIGRELDMLHGGRGEGAQRVIGPFFENQRQAVLEAGQRLATAADQPLTTASRNEAGARIAAGLQRARQTAEESVDAAYTAFRGMPGEINAEVIDELPRRVQAALTRRDIDTGPAAAALYPNATTAMRVLQAEANRIAGEPPGGGLALRRLEVLRRNINQAINRAVGKGDNGDAAAATVIKGEFDAWVDDVVERAMLNGDEATLRQLRQARGLAADLAQRFDENAIVRRLSQAGATDVDTARALIGMSAVGNQANAARALRIIRDTLGPEDFQSLREATLQDVLQPLSTSLERGQRPAYQTVDSRLTVFLDGDGAAIARELFSPEELGRMRVYRDLLRRLTPPAGADNFSNTSYAGARILADTVGAIFGPVNRLTFGLAGEMASVVPNAVRAAQARDATAPFQARPLQWSQTSAMPEVIGALSGQQAASIVGP